jgi:hypothetical protein
MGEDDDRERAWRVGVIDLEGNVPVPRVSCSTICSAVRTLYGPDLGGSSPHAGCGHRKITRMQATTVTSLVRLTDDLPRNVTAYTVRRILPVQLIRAHPAGGGARPALWTLSARFAGSPAASHAIAISPPPARQGRGRLRPIDPVHMLVRKARGWSGRTGEMVPRIGSTVWAIPEGYIGSYSYRNPGSWRGTKRPGGGCLA